MYSLFIQSYPNLFRLLRAIKWQSSVILFFFMDQHSTFSVQADFTEEVLRGRFIEEHFTPAMLTSNHWQVFMLLSCYLKIRTILQLHVKFLL